MCAPVEGKGGTCWRVLAVRVTQSEVGLALNAGGAYHGVL